MSLVLSSVSSRRTGECDIKRDTAAMVPTRAQVHPYPISGLWKEHNFANCPSLRREPAN